LRKPGSAAFDRHGQAAITEKRVLTISVGRVAHREVILNVALKEVPSLPLQGTPTLIFTEGA
jgi:hypothetical protein